MNTTQNHLNSILLLSLLVSTGLLAQHTEDTVLDSTALETHVRDVVKTASNLQVDKIDCPVAIPQRQGVVSICKVFTAEGEMSVFIEQTDSEGAVFGTLDNPQAGEVLKPFQDAFMKRISTEPSSKFYDDWLVTGMKELISSSTLDGMLACRRATMKQIASAQRIGANISADASTAFLVLRLESEARPLSAKFYLVPEEGGWRLNGMLFPPALPKILPPPEQVRERFNSFIHAYNEGDWDSALHALTPELTAATPRLRPAAELALKRSLLGRVEKVGDISLSFNDSGGISATAPVQMEHTAGTASLSFFVCGEHLELNGYEIAARPDHPVQITSDQMVDTLELQLWRDGFGEVAVSCSDFESVMAGENVSVECRAQRGDETVRAIVTFKSIDGDYDMEMVPLK